MCLSKSMFYISPVGSGGGRPRRRDGNNDCNKICDSKLMIPITRQTLGSQDFPENHQKTIFATFSDAAKKPSKNLKKTFRRPWKF